ncbi:hypothetical protein ACHQM5_002941 [Ranunculus cassubicifolius]
MAVSSKGGGGRGRPYGVMLLLAFGAAVLGVMVLHKLRERRIFTLLIQDKDNDLMTLHLLLQREREIGKEMKRKIEDLKVKANFLRAQKTELKSKFSNIQSVTSSLREEVAALELAVEEKQSEIKILKEKERNSSLGNSHVSALMEILKQKEAEIEEMKGMVEKSTLSITTDDPSKSTNLEEARVLELDSNSKESVNSTNLEDDKGSSENSSDSTASVTSALVQSVNSTNLEDGKIVGEGAVEVQGGQREKLDVVDKDSSSNGEVGNSNNAEGVEVGESKHVLKLKRSRVVGGSKGTRGGRRKIIAREISGSGNGGVGSVEGGVPGVVRMKGPRTTERGETNSFKVDEVSEKLGERNGEVFEHSKDEGLRSSSKQNDSGEVRGRDQGVAVLNEKSNASSEERRGVNEADDFSYGENRLKVQNGVSSNEDSTTSTGDATRVATHIVETNETDSNSNRSTADNTEKKTDVEQVSVGVSEAANEETSHKEE